jgi:hypothetical protein
VDTDGVVHHDRFGQLDPAEPGGHGLENRSSFCPGDHLADAAMHTKSERQISALLNGTAMIELLRIGEEFRITVCSGQEEPAF